MVVRRACLSLAVVTCSAVSFAARLSDSPPSQPAEGTLIWPKPQLQVVDGTQGLVKNPHGFQFVATGAQSSILAAAFKRYHALCFSAAASSHQGGGAAPVNTSELVGLDVNVISAELELSLTTSENYTLHVGYPRATLVAVTVFGALRGLETFSQLLQDDHTITAQTVVDWPRFPFRGVRWASSSHR